jgi:regulator of protease activity HflC (stomatin/prohibitin superfamily)
MSTKAPEIDSEVEVPLTFRQRLGNWLARAEFLLYLVLVLVLLAIGFLWQRMFVIIPSGSRGVMYRTLQGGTVTDRIWDEGLQIIPPWDKLIQYDVRLKQTTVTFKVLSDEGLSLGVQVVVRHRPHEELLGYLHRDIGSDYFETLIKPEVEAHIRRTFGGRPAHEIFASARDVLQEMGQFPLIGRSETGDKGVSPRPYLYVQELKLVAIELPKIVEDSILEKYHQEQLMLAYRYRLEREEKEADRKRTEAAGIRDFNLIAGKVSPDMLRWRSIDATLELAKSTNSKLIILGGSEHGPLLSLNLADPLPPPAVKEPAPAEAPAAPPAPAAPAPAARPTAAEAANPPTATPPPAAVPPPAATPPRNRPRKPQPQPQR